MSAGGARAPAKVINDRDLCVPHGIEPVVTSFGHLAIVTLDARLLAVAVFNGNNEATIERAGA